VEHRSPKCDEKSDERGDAKARDKTIDRWMKCHENNSGNVLMRTSLPGGGWLHVMIPWRMFSGVSGFIRIESLEKWEMQQHADN
jgi:hypothetical protein